MYIFAGFYTIIFFFFCSKVATDKDNGILLYKGDNDPLALELYQGHVRLIYDTVNAPPTTIYR